jgi:hypothetical protein
MPRPHPSTLFFILAPSFHASRSRSLTASVNELQTNEIYFLVIVRLIKPMGMTWDENVA